MLINIFNELKYFHGIFKELKYSMRLEQSVKGRGQRTRWANTSFCYIYMMLLKDCNCHFKEEESRLCEIA